MHDWHAKHRYLTNHSHLTLISVCTEVHRGFLWEDQTTLLRDASFQRLFANDNSPYQIERLCVMRVLQRQQVVYCTSKGKLKGLGP